MWGKYKQTNENDSWNDVTEEAGDEKKKLTSKIEVERNILCNV